MKPTVVLNVYVISGPQRYLGTVREEETLNILLEFVPGGSISSLLGKFGPFPEAVCLCQLNLCILGDLVSANLRVLTS